MNADGDRSSQLMSSDASSSPPPLRGRSDRAAVREGGQQPAHHRAISEVTRNRARSLRHNMTEAEKRLWYWLRAHRFNGIAFRRQTPIGPYIVDFVSHELRLVIEIDGGQHAESKSDAPRTDWLNSKDYRVLRFWNSEVLKNRDSVLARIANAIRRARPPSRHPRTAFASGDLPLKGGGEISRLSIGSRRRSTREARDA
jgi:very-short-patch-repair endonuclease